MTTTPMPLVQMFSPDGTLGNVPYDRMHDALNAGAKMAVNVKSPDGSLGYVPADRLTDVVKAGGTVIPYDLSGTTGTQYLPGRGFGMDVARGMGLDADKIAAAEDSGGEGAALQELGSQVLSGLKSLIKDPLSPITGSAANFQDAVNSGSPGQIVGAVASILGGAEGTDVPGALGDVAANTLRDETGKLRPGVKAVSRGLGAWAGHATGLPGMELAGVFAGPSLADALIPGREPSVAKAVPIRTSPYFDPESYQEGASLRSPGNSTPSTPSTDLPAGNATPFNSGSNGSGVIVDPNSPAPALNRTYQSYPRQLLVSLANRGDVNALRELLRNPGGIDVQQAVPNAGYLLGDFLRPNSSR